MARDGREHVWALLDILDERPALKRSLLIGLPAFLLAVGLGAWGYHHWARTNAIRIARQWLDADRLDRAAVAVQDAIATEPGMPASWRLASELAWKKGNRSASADYARKAAAVSRYQADDVLAWGEASVLSDDLDQTQEAETYLDPKTARESPRALRLAGEVARRTHRYGDARDDFQAALQADIERGAKSPAVDEVPLGIVCLQAGPDADRARGQALLGKWAPDAEWGAEALRALLADAVAHRDRDAAVRWAETLSRHPRYTLGDVPTCLQALAEFDPVLYQGMLGPLEGISSRDPTKAAQLLGWLTKIGQGAEAVRWGRSLDPAAAQKPPIAMAFAEALRETRLWADLRDWVDRAEWGHELDFMGWAYGMAAARELGDGPRADGFWRSLSSDGAASPAHALFAGDSLYAWGYPKEAAALLWAAAERPDLAYQALGSLARLYQMQRDAAGQFRAFSRLNAMRPGDRKIANNFAYFAALTDLGSLTHVEPIAEDNYSHEPGNAAYRCTYAFVLVWSGQAARALAVMEPLSRDWRKVPAVAFAYGAALARVGRKAEAREVFDSIDAGTLSPQETDWIAAALR